MHRQGEAAHRVTLHQGPIAGAARRRAGVPGIAGRHPLRGLACDIDQNIAIADRNVIMAEIILADGQHDVGDGDGGIELQFHFDIDEHGARVEPVPVGQLAKRQRPAEMGEAHSLRCTRVSSGERKSMSQVVTASSASRPKRSPAKVELQA